MTKVKDKYKDFFKALESEPRKRFTLAKEEDIKVGDIRVFSTGDDRAVGLVTSKSGEYVVYVRLQGAYGPGVSTSSRRFNQVGQLLGTCPEYVSDEEAEEFGQGCIQTLRNQKLSNYSVFVVVTVVDGLMVPVMKTAACHYDMQCIKGTRVAVVSSPSITSWSNRESGWSFLQYLVNASPYSNIFKNIALDPEETQSRGLIIDIDLPASYIMLGLVGTRVPHEYPKRSQLWYDAIQAGGDPYVMLLLMYAYDHWDSPSKGSLIKINDCMGMNHDMYEPTHWGEDSLRRFIRGGIIESRSYRKTPEYRGVFKLYGETKGTAFQSHLPLDPDDEVIRKGWDGEVHSKTPVTTYEGGVQQIAMKSNQIKETYCETK